MAFSAAADNHLFLPAQKYYVGNVVGFGGGERNRHNDVCHDFNGDGIGDVFFMRPCDESTYRLVILQGNPDGSFQPIREVEVIPCGANLPIVFDYDGNGLDDIMSLPVNSDYFYIGLNNGTDTWTSTGLLNSILVLTMNIQIDVVLAACDCDDDGVEEFAAGSGYYDQDIMQPTVILDYDSEYPTLITKYMVDTGGFVVWTDAGFGDFNGDGITDLMERSYYSDIRIHAGDGNCQFHLFDYIDTVLDGYAVIGDFNGDGIDDFVHSHEMLGCNPGFCAQVVYGNAAGLIEGPKIPTGEPSEPLYISLVADVNADGMDDIGIVQHADDGVGKFRVCLYFSEGESFSATCDTLLLQSSDGYLSAEREGYNVYGWDFNDDGYDDICYMSAPDTFSVLLNAGTVATELQAFDSHYDEDLGVVLEWRVTGANEGDSYIVSRSIDSDADAASSRLQKIAWISAESSENTYSTVDSDLSIICGMTARYVLSVEESPGRIRVLGESLQYIPSIPLVLQQNFPNPFNPATTIKYYLPENSTVLLEIFDVTGKRIAGLINETQEKGQYSIDWNGRDVNNNPVSSGTYFYRLTAGKKTISKKMVLLR